MLWPSWRTTNDDQNVQRRAALSDAVDVEPFHPVSAAALLEVGAASEGGPGRTHNTDHYLAIRIGRLQETLMTSLPAADLPGRFEEYGYAMLVADGLGEGSGARASRVALSTLAHLAIRYGKWNVRIDPETPAQIVEQGRFFYRQANDAVFRANRAAISLTGMATSLTALSCRQRSLFCPRRALGRVSPSEWLADPFDPRSHIGSDQGQWRVIVETRARITQP